MPKHSPSMPMNRDEVSGALTPDTDANPWMKLAAAWKHGNFRAAKEALVTIDRITSCVTQYIKDDLYSNL